MSAPTPVTLGLDIDHEDVDVALTGCTDAQVAALWPAALAVITDVHRRTFPRDRADVTAAFNQADDGGVAALSTGPGKSRAGAGGAGAGRPSRSGLSGGARATQAPVVDTYAAHLQRFLGLRSALARAGMRAGRGEEYDPMTGKLVQGGTHKQKKPAKTKARKKKTAKGAREHHGVAGGVSGGISDRTS